MPSTKQSPLSCHPRPPASVAGGPGDAPLQAEGQRAGGGSVQATQGVGSIPLWARWGPVAQSWLSLAVAPQGRSRLRPAAGDPLAPLPGGTIGFKMTGPRPLAIAGLDILCTDSWLSVHLRSRLRRCPSHRPSPLLDLSPAEGRARSSWAMTATAACGPQTRRVLCPPVPAGTLQLAPGCRPLSVVGAAVGAASMPRWSPVTAASDVTAGEQLAAQCRCAAVSDRTRRDMESDSSQSGAWEGPAHPPDPADAGPRPGSGRKDRRPALHRESGPGAPRLLGPRN